MKKIFNLSFALALSLSFCACTKMMETAPEGYYVTSKQKAEITTANPDMVSAGVNGIFAQFSTYMSVTGDRHNDFGYPSVMLFTDGDGIDVLSQDNGYNWVSGGLDFSERVYTSYESEIIWKTLYSMIYTANTLASTVVDPEEPETKFYLAQALGTRAFSYWVLAQLYQFNYVDHKSSLCVPIVTEANAGDVAMNGAPRATVEAVYTQILADVNKAIELLEGSGMSAPDKRYIGLDVAYGLRARVDLTMENWASAADFAKKAIEVSSSSPYTIAQASRPAFTNAKDNSFMWGILIAETDRVVTSGIVNWLSHMGSFNYGYCWYAGGRQINNKLFESIPDTDVRKCWWIDSECYSPMFDSQPDGADLDYVINTYVEYPPYTQVKFAPYKDELLSETNAVDMPLMRIEEMYYILAEGLAMSGNTTDAKIELDKFVKDYRDPSFEFVIGDKKAMQDQIWNQRRIEFWGEGLAWFDIMRLKKDIDRRGLGYPDATSVLNIKYGDNIMLWRLPECEIQANPAIEESDNNPVAPQPTPVPDNN